jgi:hypothetical protein
MLPAARDRENIYILERYFYHKNKSAGNACLQLANATKNMIMKPKPSTKIYQLTTTCQQRQVLTRITINSEYIDILQ